MRYVEPILLLYMLSISIEYTFVQELISVKICTKKLNITDKETMFKQCGLKTSFQKYENEYLDAIFIYGLILGALPLVTTTLMGSWNDLFGRRFTMLLPALFTLLVEIILTFASSEILEQDIIVWIMICAFLSGLSGSASSMISSTHSYLTCHVDKMKMTLRMTILEACIFIGGFLGFNIASRILRSCDPNDKFYYGFLTVAVINLFIIIYIHFLKDKDEKKINFMSLINIKHFINTFTFMNKSRSSYKKIKLYVLYFCSFISSLALCVQQILLFTYLKGFKWSTDQYSSLQGLISLMNGLSLVVFFPIIQQILNKKFKLNNYSSSDNRPDERLEQASNSVANNSISRENIIENNETNNRANESVESSTEDYDLEQKEQLERVDTKIDSIIVGLGFVSKFLGLGLLSLVSNDYYITFLPFLLMFNEFSMPGLRSMISKTVESDEKGKAFGLLAFCKNLSYFIGSLVFNKLYALTKSYYRGFTFGLVSLFQLSALLSIGLILVKMKRS